ncbi:MAG TPA: phosphate-starvation-inducible PsiE family protein [Calidithermus sp.]|nr:phosphate-starvation-inducible PsiE family protein [Calidithermus sp.]
MSEPARVSPAPRNRQSVAESQARGHVASVFTRVEDVVYVGLGVLLAATAVVLLGFGVVEFARHALAGSLPETVVPLLDRVLLILMIVEILYTVQVSFREHQLVPEPFLVVGLIAAIRRVLVLTAEFSRIMDRGEAALRAAMIELAILTVLVVALVVSLVLLRRRPGAAAER